LFASITAVLCTLSVGAFVFWFRQRMRIRDKVTEEQSYSSAVNYWEPGTCHDDRIFHTNNNICDGHAIAGKRLSYSGSERREIVHREARRIASLPLIDCKKISPNMNNGVNLLRRHNSRYEMGSDELYPYPMKPLIFNTSEQSMPVKLVWDRSAQTTSIRENNFVHKNYLPQKKITNQSNGEMYCKETLELPTLKQYGSSCHDLIARREGRKVNHSNVVTVTTFGPNETINTELW
jgi:hypothetical protein